MAACSQLALSGLGSSESLCRLPGLACLPFFPLAAPGDSVSTSIPCFSKHSGSLNTVGMCPILLDAMPDASAGWQGDTRGDAVIPLTLTLTLATFLSQHSEVAEWALAQHHNSLFKPPSTPPLSRKQWYGSPKVEAAALLG